MATQAQVLANRENARHSTGPRTEAGKQASAANATTHGLSSADPVLDTEDRDQFNQLFEKYCAEFQPSGEHETFLVRQMTHSRWRLQRIQHLEIQYFDMLIAGDDNLGILAEMERKGTRVLDALQRYAAAAERSYYRAYKELADSRKTDALISARAATVEAKTLERDILAYINAPLPFPPSGRPDTGRALPLKS